MIDIFTELDYNIKFNWNIDKVLSQLTTELQHPTNVHRIYTDPSGKPHWQYFPLTCVSFARNFNYAFPDVCNDIKEQILNLQDSARNIRSPNWLINEFINHPVNTNRITLIKIKAGLDVKPHYDVRRHLALNIGLKNSSSCETHFSRNPIIEEFWNETTDSFVMQDNKAYLLQVSKNHAVKSLVDNNSNIERIIISYTILNDTERNSSNYGEK